MPTPRRPSAAPVLRRSGQALLLGLLGLLGLPGLLAGCGAPAAPPSVLSSAPGGSPSALASASPRVPDDGMTLAQLGFASGPAGFSVPVGTAVTSSSDQPQTVTLVMSAPDTADLAAYLASTLPAGGFRVTGRAAQGSDVTLTFAGRGWQGTFTGTGDLSGVTLSRLS